MSTCRSEFVSEVNWFHDINQLILNARTAVVVKKSPTAAVAVNKEKFILRTILKTIIIFLYICCIRKYF